MNLSNAIEPFLDSRSDSESTQRTYRTGLGRFQEFMEERLGRQVAMDDLYPSCLLDFDMWLGRKGLREGSRQTYVASVLAFFNNSKLHETLPSGFDLERAVLIRKDKQKRGGHHSRPAAEFNEIPEVIAYLDSRVPPDMSGKKGKAKYLAALRDRAIAWMAYVTGARQGTLRKLKIKQVRDARGDIYKEFPVVSKGGKQIVLFFQEPAARQALADYLAARDQGSRFPPGRGDAPTQGVAPGGEGTCRRGWG
jgi:site-specific recombinase XerD